MPEKKRYNLYLNVESTEIVKDHLEKLGLSFSAFVNTMVSELANEIKGQPSPFNKKLSDMTIEEFGKLLSYWVSSTESV